MFSGVKDQGENGIPMTVTNAARCEWYEDKTGSLIGKRMKQSHNRAGALEPGSERVFAAKFYHTPCRDLSWFIVAQKARQITF